MCVSNIPIYKILKYFGSLFKSINDQSGTWCDGSGYRGTWLHWARQDEAWREVRWQKLRIEKRDRYRGSWGRRGTKRGRYGVGLGATKRCKTELVQDRVGRKRAERGEAEQSGTGRNGTGKRRSRAAVIVSIEGGTLDGVSETSNFQAQIPRFQLQSFLL